MIVQIETKIGWDNVEQIAAVDGIDCLFVGPADLAADIGYLGKNAEAIPQAAIADVIARTVGLCSRHPCV